MFQYKKPAHWSNPKNKLFPHQVGFTCPPHDFDAAPTDFLRIAPGTVGVHGRMLRVPGLTLESVLRKLKDAAKAGAVFSKDFPHYFSHILDDELLGMFNHSFLIRDPAKTITSMFSKWPNFHEDEVGFKEQRELFDMICERDGAAPPILDSDDLLEAPHEMVRHWCEAVQIPFIASALSWTPSARTAVGGAVDP